MCAVYELVSDGVIFGQELSSMSCFIHHVWIVLGFYCARD